MIIRVDHSKRQCSKSRRFEDLKLNRWFQESAKNEAEGSFNFLSAQGIFLFLLKDQNGLSHELKSGIKIFILLFSRIKNKNLGWTKTKKISATKWIRWLAREEATFPGQPILSKREWGKKIITSKCRRHPETLRSPWLGFSALGIPVLKSVTCAKLHRWKCSKTKRYDATNKWKDCFCYPIVWYITSDWLKKAS